MDDDHKPNIHTEHELDWGVGVFLFCVSLVPYGFQTIVRLIGFSADRSRGRMLLQRVAESTSSRSGMALIMLFWIESVFYENHERAEEIYQRSRATMHTSPLFDYLGGYLARKTGRLPEALARFSRCAEHCEEVYALRLMSRYECGWCHYTLENWDICTDLLVEFLEEHRGTSFRAYAAYQLSYALCMQGHSDRALQVAQSLPAWVRKHFSFDAFAARKGAALLEAGGLSMFQRQMVHTHTRTHPHTRIHTLIHTHTLTKRPCH